jgi:Protein of unknown function DUF2625
MRKIWTLIIISISVIPCAAQTMRPIEDLINTKDPGWPLVQDWIAKAKNAVEILLPDSARTKEAVYKTQVTTRSPMGAIIYSTGGLLVDHGWIRILGSGSARLSRTIPDWNKGKSYKELGETPGFLLVADDVIGGFFAIDGGGLGKSPGKVYYWAPDTLEWEEVADNYSDFLLFCLNGDLQKYYADYRWKGWVKEVSVISGDQTFNFFPPLWTKEGKSIAKSSRKAIPVEEQYNFNLDMKKKLGVK